MVRSPHKNMRPHRILTLGLLVAAFSANLAAFENGEVYLDTRVQVADAPASTTFDLRVYRTPWSYAVHSGSFPLIQKLVPFAESRFLIPVANRVFFHRDGVVSLWDGVPRLFTEPGKGYEDIFAANAELSEIAPSRAGRYLVAERFGGDERGAKLIEFDANGVIGEYRFPDVESQGRAVGARFIELLADRCTVLYTNGDDDPRRSRVGRMNLCTGEAGDFAVLNPGDYGGAIRQLPSGDVLVANGHAILRFTRAGVLIGSSEFPGATHLALSPDARTLWAAAVESNMAELREYDLFGNWRSIALDGPGTVSSYVPIEVANLVVVGEWRAASTVQRERAVRRR